jgi:hypothetical protein
VRRHLALLLLSACGGEEPGASGELGQPTEVSFAGWTPHVQVVLDGHDAEWMLVDTGAPYTYVDPERYAVDEGVSVLRDRTVNAFGLVFDDRDVRILDLGNALAGLLGADLLSGYQFLLDYQNDEARLLDTDLPFDTAADTMPPDVVDAAIIGGGHRIVVDGEIEGVAARVLIDTGASYVTVDPSFLADLGGATRPELCCQTVITADGVFDVPLTRIKSVRLGGVAEVESVVASPEYDGSTLLDRLSDEIGGAPLVALIGGTYLREFLLTVDYRGDRLWLERYRNPDHVPFGEYVGPGFELGQDQKERLIVTLVYEGTDADAQGVSVDTYELLEIDGAPVAGMPIAGVRERIRDLEADAETTFVFYVAPLGQNVTLDLLVEDQLPDYR